jgi:hypothetical protein
VLQTHQKNFAAAKTTAASAILKSRLWGFLDRILQSSDTLVIASL